MWSEEDFDNFKKRLLKKAKLFYFQNQIFVFVIFIGLLLLLFGIIFAAKNKSQPPAVEILGEATNVSTEIVVEIAGAVLKPGVYKLPNNSRVEDLLIVSGGLSESADRLWVEKNINRAAKLTDGQKIYLPKTDEQSNISSAKNTGDYQTISTNLGSSGGGVVNINTASQSELEKLEGIGPVYAQNIIEHRPYSNTEELVSKDVLKNSVFNKIKDKISI